MKSSSRCAGCVAALLWTCSHAAAGDLNPPVGPISETMRTLDEVEPRTIINAENTPGDLDSTFRITQPGSYYLTGNVVGATGKHGIEIAASGVTVDLMGFRLIVGAGLGTLDGIRVEGDSRLNIAVRNGVVEGWTQHGVSVWNADGAIVEGIRASANGVYGVWVGSDGLVTECIAWGNLFGIRAGSGCIVTRCGANENTIGIDAGSGSIVTECMAADNETVGITVNSATISACFAWSNGLNGIQAGTGSNVSGCTANQNGENGITLTGQCYVYNNTCHSNGFGASEGAGVYAFGDDNRIEGNHCVKNDLGVEVFGVANTVVRNTCVDNGVNFEIAAGNRYGQIVDHTTSTPPAVSGNSAPNQTGTEDPWANFANESP